jgi:hypothetical protein
LSDKLHSIPKEAIHVTPKEFSRSDPESGNVVIRLNGLGVPQPQDDHFTQDVPGAHFFLRGTVKPFHLFWLLGLYHF